MITRELHQQWTRSVQSWIDIWFAPATCNQPQRLFYRLLSVFCVVWYASFFPSVAIWFADGGLLSRETASAILDGYGVSRLQSLSPLWWSGSALVYYLWLSAGIAVSVVGVSGRFPKPVRIAQFVIAFAWVQRISWTVGPVEPLILAMLLYQLIADPANALSWRNTVAVRVAQVHLVSVLLLALATKLAGIAWWQGSAVWALVSAGQSGALTSDMLLDHPEFINFLTHSVIAIELMTLFLLCNRSFRWLGVISGWVSCIAIAFIWDQWQYALLIAACLMLFWSPLSTAQQTEPAMQ